MDNNFLVDNPNKPKAKKPPRKPIISDKRMKEITYALFYIDYVVPSVALICVADIYAPGSVPAMAGALVGSTIFATFAGAVLNKLHDGSVGSDFIWGGLANLVICSFYGVFLFHAPDIAANLTSNATELANMAGNIIPAFNNSAANATALSNVSQSITCTHVPALDTTNHTFFACLCPVPPDQVPPNATIPVQQFFNSTIALGAVAGSVREANARVSKKFGSLTALDAYGHADATATASVGAVGGPMREVRSLISRKLESLNRSLKL